MAAIVLPNLNSLRDLLATGKLPASLTNSATSYDINGAGAVTIGLAASVSRTTAALLAKHGGKVQKLNGATLPRSALCWAAILPLKSAAMPLGPALFAVPWKRAVDFAAELGRLQVGTVRWANTDDRVYLRVEHPPYFSLLRAHQSSGDEIQAYHEQSPGVWVQAGFRHDLPQLPCARGRLALCRTDGWEQVAIDQFHDFDSTAELPVQKVASADVSATPVAPVKPRLVAANAGGSASLWLLSGNGDMQLHEWIRHADERAVGSLMAARIKHEKTTRIALIGRPGVSPPGLAFDAQAFVPYLRLANLLVPERTTLRPALRRDAARRHFAANDGEIMLLTPTDAGIESLRIAAGSFRPLLDWVNYQAPAVKVVSPIAIPTRSSPDYVVRPSSKPERNRVAETSNDAGDDRPLHSIEWRSGEWKIAGGPCALADEPNVPITQCEAKILREAARGKTVKPTTWNELAELYFSAGRFHDAALGWLQSIWSKADATAIWNWRRAEATAAGENANADDVLHWLNQEPTPTAHRVLAACVVQDCGHDPSPALSRNVGAIRERLRKHRDHIPIQAAWLADLALHQLAGGDPMELARYSHELLDRTLKPGLDVPAFLADADGRGIRQRIRADVDQAMGRT